MQACSVAWLLYVREERSCQIMELTKAPWAAAGPSSAPPITAARAGNLDSVQSCISCCQTFFAWTWQRASEAEVTCTDTENPRCCFFLPQQRNESVRGIHNSGGLCQACCPWERQGLHTGL